MSKRLDGQMLSGMLKNGYANLYLHENEINDLNVFPVADGDTGVNMRLTLEHGLRAAQPYMHVGKYLQGLSGGALLGARGNSGVILSQIIKGWAVALENCSVVGVGELRNAFIRGYRQAYASVARPVEGTILTVTREGIENIRQQINRSTTIEELLSMYLAEMKKSLAHTPDILEVLKKANVVDSGAVGYITIIEGMLKYLFGQTIERPRPDGAKQSAKESDEKAKPVDFSNFNENSTFELGYCTEFILQLLKDPAYRQDFDLNGLIAFLDGVGNSTVCVKDGTRVKVHVHTRTPEKVIAYIRRFGEFLSFHIDNMQLQHNEQLHLKKSGEKKPLAVITVANGGPLCDILKGLGCDEVIDVGPSMNVSPSEFIEALERTDADNIVIMPNNKNTVSSAKQAAALYKGKAKLTVIPTQSVIEGYCAVAMDVRDNPDCGYRIKQMISGADGVHTLSVAVASKDYSDSGIQAAKGQYISLIDDDIVFACGDITEAVLKGLELHPDIEEKNICLVIYGEGTEDAVSDIEDAISDRFPDLEISVMEGGQKVHKFLIGLI